MAHVLTHQASVVAATMLLHVLASAGLKASCAVEESTASGPAFETFTAVAASMSLVADEAAAEALASASVLAAAAA